MGRIAPRRWPTGPLVQGRARLIAYSALMLFTELALIRWLGSNVYYLSFFSNFILLGSFLGIGVGFLRSRSSRDLSGWAPIALAALVVLVEIFPIRVQRSSEQLIFFGGGSASSGLPPWVALPILFAATATVMTFIGEGVARTFRRYPPLTAYRLDIVGSLIGILAFSGLALLWAPPLAWGAIVAALFLAIYGRGRLLPGAAIAAVLVALAVESFTPGLSWSPYYKVTQVPVPGTRTVHIYVDGIPHQEVVDVLHDPTHLSGWREWPYQDLGRNQPLNNVLIVGAGTGNDVELALHNGAKHIDAVEIDPRLYQIGVQEEPANPYGDPRVQIHIDDGRAFLQQTSTKYDLILFALPDSLTLVSGQASLRLESYLFTEEAIEAARQHLKPGGSFSMYNYYRTQWLVDRLAGTLQTVFGSVPCVQYYGTTSAVLTDNATAASMRCPSLWHPASAASVPPPATDDYPFLYLQSPGIPSLYLWTLVPILLASVVAVRVTGGPLRPMTRYSDLFFMGAAFMLLETKSVVQFALYFGTTWFVNALVFIGVLVAVLIAIEISRHWRARRPLRLYGVLLAALAVAWLVPQEAVLQLPFAARFVVAVTLAFTPILVANLIFAQRFRDVGKSVTAFGANLLGAVVGGILEYLSMLTGYRFLLVVVAAVYGLALITGRRALGRVRWGAAEAAEPLVASLPG